MCVCAFVFSSFLLGKELYDIMFSSLTERDITNEMKYERTKQKTPKKLTLSVKFWNGSGVVEMGSVCAAELNSSVECELWKNVSFLLSTATGNVAAAAVFDGILLAGLLTGSSTIATMAIVKFTRNA